MPAGSERARRGHARPVRAWFAIAVAVGSAGCFAGARRVELPALKWGHTEAIVCDESGAAYVHVVSAGATVERRLVHLELDGHAGEVALDASALQLTAQARDGGAWALTGMALYHVRWGRVDESFTFPGGGSQMIETAPGAVVVLRRGPLGTKVFQVSRREAKLVGQFPGILLISPVADGRGGIWAVAQNVAEGTVYDGTVPIVHWDPDTGIWRFWLRRDHEDKLELAPPGTAPAGVSPLWTTEPLLPDRDGGFAALGQPRFVSTSSAYQDLLRVDRDGRVVDAVHVLADRDSVFGIDVRGGSIVQLDRAHRGAYVTRVRLPDGAERRQYVREPDGFHGGIPSQFGACASGQTVWISLASVIVGESGADRVEFVEP